MKLMDHAHVEIFRPQGLLGPVPGWSIVVEFTVEHAVGGRYRPRLSLEDGLPSVENAAEKAAAWASANGYEIRPWTFQGNRARAVLEEMA